MSDLISRQAVLDKFKSLCDVCGEGDKYNGVMCRACALDDGICIVEDIPSAEKWIPVTEALPEICQKDIRGNVTFSKQVWTCQKYGNDFYWQSIDQYTTNNGGRWLSEVPHDDPNDCCKVVAWMPLPEPYEVK